MIEKKAFTGKLNTDTSSAALPDDDFLNAQNVRIMSSRNGEMAAVQAVEGNFAVSYTPIATDGFYHQVIGACEDRKENRIFYFVYASSGDHKILCYDVDSNSTTKIVHNDDISGNLNFQENTYISSQIAGGVLYFTDGVNEPRKVPVDDILTGNFAVTDVKEITLFATPALLPIGVEKINSIDAGLRSAFSTNNMIDVAFQFSYRFIYDDDSMSVLAPYSKLVNYEDEDDVRKDAARLTISLSQKIPSRVNRIEVLYREGNTGSFFIFTQELSRLKINDHNNGSALSFVFYNDKIGTPVSEEYSTKPFDLIPRTAKTLDIAKDRLFLGNLTQGYDKYNVPDLTISELRDEDSNAPTDIIGRLYAVSWRRTDLDFRPDRYIVILIRENEDYDGLYLVRYFENISGDSVLYTFPNIVTITENSKIIDYDTFESYGANDAAFIRAVEEYEGIYNASDPPRTPTTNDSVGNPNQTAVVLGITNPSSIIGQHFKCSSRYKFGIVFYDQYGRNAGVYTNDDLIFETAPRTYSQFYFTKGVNWSVSNNNNIPIWAHSYSIVRTKNLTSDFFIQSTTGEITYATLNDDGTYELSSVYDANETTNIAISISSLIRDGLGYSFTEGDNARLWTADGQVDQTLRVEGQYGKYIICENRDLGNLSSDTGRSTGIVEIFSSMGANDIFYEVGEHYLISNPNTANRAYSTTSGIIDGDTWTKPRKTTLDTLINMEAMSINDRQWSNWVQDIGRTNLVLYDSQEKFLPNAIRYSNSYIQDTQINGLSTFDLLDRADIDERSGDITRLIYTSSTNDSSNVLLAICQNNTASIYIGQTQVIDDSGDSILATSGAVVGTINTLKGDYGTTNGESVVLANSYVYWFDGNVRKVIRYASNGLTPLSDNGVNNLMGKVNKSNWTPGGYDENHSEYLVLLDTNTSQRLDVLYDFYETSVGGAMYNFIGVIDDNVSIFPKFSSGWYEIGFAQKGRTYEVKVAATTGDVRVRIGGSIVATLEDGGSYEFYSSGVAVEVEISEGQAAWLMEKKRSWYRVDDHKKKCLVFSEVSNAFVGTRSFIPDLMSSINDLFVSFKVGYLYTHNSDTLNNFYGTQYDSYISVVFNKAQFMPQIPKAIQVESNVAPYVHVRTELPYAQSTDITPSEFRRFDGIWYGEIKRDRLTPGVNYNHGLVRGDVVRGQIIKCYVRYTGNTNFNLRFINLESQQDRGHRLIS